MFFSLSDFYENGDNIINIHNKHKMCHLQNMLIKSHYCQLPEYDNIWGFSINRKPANIIEISKIYPQD